MAPAKNPPRPESAGPAPHLQPSAGWDEVGFLAREVKALAHPVRLRILEILGRAGRPVCVCELEAALPVKQPTVSHHLRLLRRARLIDCEERGIWAYYSVRRKGLSELWARLAALAGEPRGDSDGNSG